MAKARSYSLSLWAGPSTRNLILMMMMTWITSNHPHNQIVLRRPLNKQPKTLTNNVTVK